MLDPRAAVKDEDKLGSASVKSDIDALMKYRSNLKDIASILVSQGLVITPLLFFPCLYRVCWKNAMKMKKEVCFLL